MLSSNLQMSFICQAGVFVGIALALLLFASFGRLAEVFSKDPMVIQIVGSGVLVCIFICDTYLISVNTIPAHCYFLCF